MYGQMRELQIHVQEADILMSVRLGERRGKGQLSMQWR